MAESVSELMARLRTTWHDVATRLSGLSDEQLEQEAVWRQNPAEVRALFHRLIQHEEEHLVHMGRTLASIGVRQTDVQRILGQAQITRGELEAWMVGLGDSVLDSSPGGEEWPVRRVLGHIAGVEMRLIAETAAALDGFTQPQDAQYLVTRGAQVSGGDFAHLHNQLHRVRNEMIERMSSIPDAELTKATKWFEWEVDIRFRLLDFASHEREHIVHLIKTLQGIAQRQTEAQLLAGRLWLVHGQLEALVVGLPDAVLDEAPDGDWSPRRILEHLATGIQRQTERIEETLATVAS